ncbi:hypothetical protein CJ030_MR4G021051 [Morella rubra]|uniref:Uncharacterized protein n=1 Tax=Morella rubra TaxID=262757 RepID=A0A6A1W382_9ROSI|nr:hypothetical protein CJ030_MR4G021051 [Morella rubra]
MASTKYSSYYRLRNEGDLYDEETEDQRACGKKTRGWSIITRFVGRRRPKVRIRSLRRFLIRKRKRLSTRFKASWISSALKRLKNGQAYMGDLFAGNYLLMQL